jgi:hypothetical protein
MKLRDLKDWQVPDGVLRHHRTCAVASHNGNISEYRQFLRVQDRQLALGGQEKRQRHPLCRQNKNLNI